MSSERRITHVVVHHSATPNGRTLFTGALGQPNFRTPVEEIDAWHKERGFHRDPAWRARFNPRLEAIGYHYIVYVSGATATGRAMGEVGAHARGVNQVSIGICILGMDRFTRAQWSAAAALVRELEKLFPAARVVGHRDVNETECPGFDVAAWRARGMEPLAEHILEEPTK